MTADLALPAWAAERVTLTVEEFARLTGVPQRTVLSWTQTGVVEALRIHSARGKAKVLIPRAALEELLAKSRTGGRR